LGDVIGGEDPPPMGETDPLPDGEHAEHLRRAYGHMTKCVKRLEKALDLLEGAPLDDEPEGGPYSDDEVGPITGYTDRRSALTRQYARALKFSMAPNI
jgi:hypothetical protein